MNTIRQLKLEYQLFDDKSIKTRSKLKDDNTYELTSSRAVWRGKFSFQNWYRRLRLVLSGFCAYLTQRKMFFFNRFLVRHVHI
jgi:hypothetical protein